MAPRGIGTMVVDVARRRLGMRVDQRKIMAVGLLILGWALLLDEQLDAGRHRSAQMMLTLVLQGFSHRAGVQPDDGDGLHHPAAAAARRGAPSLQSLCTQHRLGDRHLGHVVHADAQRADDRTPTSPPGSRRSTGCCRATTRCRSMLNPATRHGAALLDQMINHQAQIIAYNNDFRMMTLIVVPPLLLLLLMRRHERRPVAAPAAGD